MVGEDWQIVHRKRITGIEDEDPAIPKIEFRSTPDRLVTDPPVLRWRADFIAPAPLRWDIKRLERLDAKRRVDRRRQSGLSIDHSFSRTTGGVVPP